MSRPIRFSLRFTWFVLLLSFGLWLSPRVHAAGIVVNNPGDNVGNDGKCTLREAISSADTNTASGALPGECGAGSSSETDVITFNGSQTINLTAGLPVIHTNVTLDGGANTVTINGGFLAPSTNEFIIFIILGGNVTFNHLTLANSGIYANTGIVHPFGGAIHLQSGAVNVRASTFLNNFSRAGGAIFVDSAGALNVTDSTFSNQGTPMGNGGAITNYGVVQVANSTFSNNAANGNGGAIENNGDLTVINSTFSGNSAKGSGGAIHETIMGANSHPAAHISFSTFKGNSAIPQTGAPATGGGALALDTSAGVLTLDNSSITSSSGQDCKSALSDGSNNLIDDTTCGSSATFRLGAASGIGPLGNYGGSTPTILLQPGSNAIDRVNCATVTTDQRGVARPQGAQCDLGAYELANTAALAVTITSKPPKVVNSKSASFAFTSATPATFTCSLDGSAFATCTSPQLYGALSDGSHTFAVQATDGAGNTGADGYTWLVDTLPPDITIIFYPPNPSGNSASFTFRSTDMSATFACRLDSAAFTACTSPATYSNLVAGNHTFVVQAMDAAGNITPASYTWSVNTTPPDTTITGRPANPSGSSASFTFSSTKAGSTFACSLDGAAFTLCTSPANYNNLAAGSHTFAVKATDPLGNTDPTPASYTWTVNPSTLKVTITGQPTNPTTSKQANFTFTSSAVNSTFTCSLDGSAFTRCTSPKRYTGLGNGSHTFTLKANDSAGNTGTATYSWVVNAQLRGAAVDDQESDPNAPSVPDNYQLYLPLVEQ